MGSFRLELKEWNLHHYFNFTKSKEMTATKSLLDSCGIIFSDQGISLHYDAQNNTAIDQTL